MAEILAIALNPTIDISSDVGRIQPTRKIRTSHQRWHPGGGGVNVARVIAMLEGATRAPEDVVAPQLAVFLGGPTGTLLKDMLSELPIELSVLPIREQTRLAFMAYETESGSEYRFVPIGPEASQAELDSAMDVVRSFEGNYVVASGSLPNNAPADTYAQMAEITRQKGGRFILDTSGEALKETLARTSVFLVKPSIGELETLAGRKLDEVGVVTVARDLVAQGKAEYVTVTLGREGALLVGKEQSVRVPARHVVVKSAVGAGDSFVGALTWSLSRGETIEVAFQLGVAAGAAAARTPGTELCHPDEVYEIFNDPNGSDQPD